MNQYAQQQFWSPYGMDPTYGVPQQQQMQMFLQQQQQQIQQQQFQIQELKKIQLQYQMQPQQPQQPQQSAAPSPPPLPSSQPQSQSHLSQMSHLSQYQYQQQLGQLGQQLGQQQLGQQQLGQQRQQLQQLREHHASQNELADQSLLEVGSFAAAKAGEEHGWGEASRQHNEDASVASAQSIASEPWNSSEPSAESLAARRKRWTSAPALPKDIGMSPIVGKRSIMDTVEKAKFKENKIAVESSPRGTGTRTLGGEAV